MKTPLQEALQHQKEHEEYLYKFGRDEAKRIQDQSGRDMDIAEWDAGEFKPIGKVIHPDWIKVEYPDEDELMKDNTEWRLADLSYNI